MATAAGGQVDIEPVGGAVAGPSEALGIDQGLDQPRPQPVTGLPVGRYATRGQRQCVAGQMRHANPRQYQKTAVVNQWQQIAFAAGLIPATRTRWPPVQHGSSARIAPRRCGSASTRWRRAECRRKQVVLIDAISIALAAAGHNPAKLLARVCFATPKWQFRTKQHQAHIVTCHRKS